MMKQMFCSTAGCFGVMGKEAGRRDLPREQGKSSRMMEVIGRDAGWGHLLEGWVTGRILWIEECEEHGGDGLGVKTDNLLSWPIDGIPRVSLHNHHTSCRVHIIMMPPWAPCIPVQPSLVIYQTPSTPHSFRSFNNGSHTADHLCLFPNGTLRQ